MKNLFLICVIIKTVESCTISIPLNQYNGQVPCDNEFMVGYLLTFTYPGDSEAETVCINWCSMNCPLATSITYGNPWKLPGIPNSDIGDGIWCVCYLDISESFCAANPNPGDPRYTLTC